MTNSEVIEMMQRCRNEILSLQKYIEHLEPKAIAYDNLSLVLSFVPKSSMRPMTEDLAFVLQRRIKDLQDHERG